jgi:hypothetical protein
VTGIWRRLVLGRTPEDRLRRLTDLVATFRDGRSPLARRQLLHALRQLATEHAAQGQHPEALAAIDEAITVCRTAPDPAMLPTVLGRRAWLLARDLPSTRDEIRALNEELLSLITPGLDTASRHRRTVAANAYQLQGSVFMHDGDYAAAHNQLLTAGRHLAELSRPLPTTQQLSQLDAMAGIFRNLSTCAQELGQLDDAERYATAARDCQRSTQDVRRSFAELRAIWSDLGTSRPPNQRP